jgi:hypothetical protein
LTTGRPPTVRLLGGASTGQIGQSRRIVGLPAIGQGVVKNERDREAVVIRHQSRKRDAAAGQEDIEAGN